jgi:hypothetical protein
MKGNSDVAVARCDQAVVVQLEGHPEAVDSPVGTAVAVHGTPQRISVVNSWYRAMTSDGRITNETLCALQL